MSTSAVWLSWTSAAAQKLTIHYSSIHHTHCSREMTLSQLWQVPDNTCCTWHRRSGLCPCHLKKRRKSPSEFSGFHKNSPNASLSAPTAANCTFVLLMAAYLSLNRPMREKHSHGNGHPVAHLTVAFFNFINNEEGVILCVCVNTNTSPVTDIVS